MKIEYRDQLLKCEQFIALFETTGWNNEYQATADELAQMLANSQCMVTAYDGESLVGFGRVVTDKNVKAICLIHPYMILNT